MAYKAIIAGASGLTGSLLVDILLRAPEYDELLILVRKELPLKHQKLTQLVVDFDKLDQYSALIKGHAVFCCLGSTRKKTPDLAVYRKIDYDYPMQLARIAAKNEVEQYHLVSSMGANASSSNFYTKMKGETEEAIKQVGLNSLEIYRPAFLTGDRKEHRSAEGFLIGLMKIIDLVLIGSLKKYRSIPAATVANVMYKQSLINKKGIFTYLSDKIKEL